jgi:formylglycine-generating enzyme required for sulfatase activity
MRCLTCQFENAEGMKFCGRCGAEVPEDLALDATDPIEDQVQCNNCATAMPAGAAYCGMCGQGLPGSEDAGVSGAASSDAPATVPSTRTRTVNRDSPPAVRAPRSEDGRQSVVPKQQVDLRSPEDSLREMVLVPPGWFAMGAPVGVGNQDEHPQHQVELSAYFLDRCAVSNIEYEQFDPDHRRLRPAEAQADRDPVVFVSYDDCLKYCAWRCEQESVPSGTYTLPTEARWERAARGGNQDHIYPWGDQVRFEGGNTLECDRGRTVAIDEGVPNGFQLFHMGGNVREWCLDWYAESYYRERAARRRDPNGPAPSLRVRLRVIRGASYADAAELLARCAARNYAHPKSSTSDIGFRCVRVSP